MTHDIEKLKRECHAHVHKAVEEGTINISREMSMHSKFEL